MRIVSHVASFSYSQPPDVPLLTAPRITALIPASTPVFFPQNKMTFFKGEPPQPDSNFKKRHLPPHIQAAFEAAQDRLMVSFAEVDAEIALLRQRYGVSERKSRYGC